MRKTNKSRSDFLLWTPPSKPTKGCYSTALSKSLGHTFADIGQSLLNMRTDAFYLLLRCYEAVFEAGLGRCWVVPQLEGEV